MCLPLIPLAIAGLAVSAAGTATAYEAQRKNASQQAAYGRDMYTATATQAGINERQQFAQSGLRQIQETQSAEQQASEAQLQAAQARGSLRASEGSSGVSGVSVDQLFNDYNRVESINENNSRQNLTAIDQQIGQQNQSFASQNQSRISGATPGPIQMPSAAASALQIGGAAVNAYSTYQQTQFNQDVLSKIKSSKGS